MKWLSPAVIHDRHSPMTRPSSRRDSPHVLRLFLSSFFGWSSLLRWSSFFGWSSLLSRCGFFRWSCFLSRCSFFRWSCLFSNGFLSWSSFLNSSFFRWCFFGRCSFFHCGFFCGFLCGHMCIVLWFMLLVFPSDNQLTGKIFAMLELQHRE